MDARDGRYLADFRRRTAETRNAIVQAALEGDRYTVKLLDTGGEVTASNAVAGTAYAVGETVVLRHDVSGRALNRGFVIIGRRVDSANGLIVGTRLVDSSKSAATITRHPPLPVQLKKGGLQVVVAIYGVNLSGIVIYGTANIVDDVAQIVRPEQITIRPRATAACAKGRYSLTVAGTVIPDFFEVL